jgi:hypothetical protein
VARSQDDISAGEWIEPFLAVLRNSGNVLAAAKAADIERKTAYDRKKADTDFATRWADALDEAMEVLEAEARRRALGTSDRLMEFLLTAHNPDKYDRRDHIQVNVGIGDISALLGTADKATLVEARKRALPFREAIAEIDMPSENGAKEKEKEA